MDDDDEPAGRIVWPPIIAASAHFADTHPIVQAVERYLEQIVFDDAEEPWAVEYVLLPGDSHALTTEEVPDDRVMQPAFLNSPYARTAIRRFLSQGLKHVRRFGFCVYAVLRGNDAIKWWRDYLEKPPAQRADAGLPAIVIDLSEVLLRYEPRADGIGGALMRKLTAELATAPGAAANMGKYDLVVYDNSADLVPVSSDLYLASWRNVAALRLPVLERLNELNQRNGAAGAVQPRTALYALAQEYDRVCRSERNHMNAEHARSTQQMVVQTRPLQATQPAPESMTTGQLFDDQTPIAAMMNLAQEQQLYTLSAAADVFEEHRRAMAAVTGTRLGQGAQPSTADRDRVVYAHSHFSDHPVKLPEFMQLGHLSTPDVINDLAQMQLQLAAGIAAAYAVPMDVAMRGQSNGPSSAPVRRERTLMGGLRTIETESDRVEHEIILRERQRVNELFIHMYTHAIAPLDVAGLDELQTTIEERQAALEMGEERQALMAAVAPSQTLGRKRSRGSRDRATLAEVRDLLDGLRSTQEARGSIARITFKYSRSAENSARLSGLLELYDRGLLDYTELQEPARALFGPEVSLREPPQPEVPAAGGAGPAAAKKPRKV
jgi:hypothetical protein